MLFKFKIVILLLIKFYKIRKVMINFVKDVENGFLLKNEAKVIS